jgi:hypothetical protein
VAPLLGSFQTEGKINASTDSGYAQLMEDFPNEILVK